MTRSELLAHHESMFVTAQKLMEKKNKDYAGNDGQDAFGNFTRCEKLGVCSAETGILTRMLDKFARLTTFANSGNLSCESVDDTLVDLINYAVILSAYIKDKEADTNAP